MSIEDILKLPDSEILRVGLFVKIVVSEWHKITGQQPDVCDCQLPSYLRTVRRYYNRGKATKFYFDGRYFDINGITETEKQYICTTNPTFYANIASKYGWNN